MGEGRGERFAPWIAWPRRSGTYLSPLPSPRFGRGNQFFPGRLLATRRRKTSSDLLPPRAREPNRGQTWALTHGPSRCLASPPVPLSLLERGNDGRPRSPLSRRERGSKG